MIEGDTSAFFFVSRSLFDSNAAAHFLTLLAFTHEFNRRWKNTYADTVGGEGGRET